MGARSKHSPGTALYQREVDFEGIRFTVVCSASNDLYFATLAASPLPPALSLARVRCPPDGVIVDVGANIGVAALGFSRICPEGTVVAVEPGERAHADLRAGIALNSASNVRAVKAALGDVEGYADLHEVTWNTAGSFLRRDASPASDAHTTAGTVEARVRVTTLDDLVDHENLTRVDLVKIDVEGNEPDVLDGATRTLDRFHPLVVVEFNVFTLSVMAGRNPLAFLLHLLERFPYLYAVDIELRVAPVRSIADAYLVTAQCFGDGYGVELVGAYEPFERTSLPGKGQRRAIAALQGRVR